MHKIFMNKEIFKQKGQVMLLAVLVLSGTILGATTIAGLLMLNQLRQATNIGLSMQAIFIIVVLPEAASPYKKDNPSSDIFCKKLFKPISTKTFINDSGVIY